MQQQTIIHKRINKLNQLIWFIIFLLVASYAKIQLWNGKEMKKRAFSQAMKNRTTTASRGIIFDRNGNKLVDNLYTSRLILHCENITNNNNYILLLAKVLRTNYDQLKNIIDITRRKSNNKTFMLKDNLTDKEIMDIESIMMRFSCLTIERIPRRVYLGGNLAGHVLGYVGEATLQDINKDPEHYQLGEIIGRAGFEASRNNQLKGIDGQEYVITNAIGQEINSYNVQSVSSGQDIYLTLDTGLQIILQDAFGKLHGAGIVIDLKDGGILAMHSSPSYDPNMFLNKLTKEQVKKFWDNSNQPMLNRAIQGRYPPGSTFKLITALTALEKGIINPNTTITCHGHKVFYGRDFRCDGIHGNVNLFDAIAQSCDIYFYELGLRLDIDDIYSTAKKYGILDLTGIDLPHESISKIPNREWKKRVKKEKWYTGETISVAIGQGATSITPIALARFYAMLATRGKLLVPHILYGINNNNNNKIDIYSPPKILETKLNHSIWAILDESLYRVVHSGTARTSSSTTINMVGKTGTSQITTFIDKIHYAHLDKKLKDNALFAGYAPRENPEIAFVIIAENAGFGASSAAPIARKLCQYWFIDRIKKPLTLESSKYAYKLNQNQKTIF